MNEWAKSIIALRRPEYEANLAAWERNERRFIAGEDVYDDLRPFQWESVIATSDSQTGEGTQAAPSMASFEARKDAAVCVEFAAMVREKFGGLVFQHFPKEGGGLDFGNLRTADKGWRADALLANADGTGKNARALDAFFRDELEMAMSTRYRWILAESPAGGAESREEEESARPYFVGFSPRAVPYWFESRGNLECIHILLTSSEPVATEKGVVVEIQTRHYLMTRQGFTGWGTAAEAKDPRYAFDQGGWWLLDDDGRIVTAGEAELYGDWEETNGQIPVAPLFYERGAPGDRDTGITHIGRIQAEFMNQLSAMFYSSWTGGDGTLFFLGADPEQWEAIRKAGLLGSRWAPVPPKTSDTGAPANVSVVSQAAFDASPAIVKSLEWLLKLATQLIIRELTTSPDASGLSRQMEFLQGNTPRLSNMASNLQECMTTMLRFLEQRWGFAKPEASAVWPRHFDLRTTLEKIKSVIEIMALASAQSPTAVGDLIVAALVSEGLIPDSDEGKALAETIRNEVADDARSKAQEQDALQGILRG